MSTQDRDQLPLGECQWRLAIVWLLGSAILSTLILVQIAGGKYGDEDNKAWSWLLPNVLPTLSMISGAIVYQVKNQAAPMSVTKFAFRAAWWLSLLYLLLTFSVVMLVPVAEIQRHISPIDWLSRPSALLTGLSAIVSATLGAFFVSSKPKAQS